jgi:hypothetical protein
MKSITLFARMLSCVELQRSRTDNLSILELCKVACDTLSSQFGISCVGVGWNLSTDNQNRVRQYLCFAVLEIMIVLCIGS